MSDHEELDGEPVAADQDPATFDKHLYAAIRQANRLDAEIDDEYRKLADGEYDQQGPAEDLN